MKEKTSIHILELFNQIVIEKITPNQFYLLCSMKESISPSIINVHQDLKILEDNFWVKNISTDDNISYELQPKAISLIAKVDSYFKIHKKKTSSQLMGKEYTKNLKTYNDTFPKKKGGHGKYLRSSVNNLEQNFRWFFENFEYSWETVLKATALYLDKQEQENYKYTRTSMYFIRKKDGNVIGSDLADYCALLEDGDIEDETPTSFKDKVV